ncbi:MAG TPA: hypothetical protein VJO54_09840 [Burkholderiales bacterium]|nr:hypothetical protein [Burkholderiales bacterium]
MNKQRQHNEQYMPALAHTPRPHPPLEEPEEPDEHVPETEPGDDELETPRDPPQRPPRPGQSRRRKGIAAARSPRAVAWHG